MEIGLLSDLFWGLAPRSHTGGRGWTADQLTAGEERLRARGLLGADGQLTAEGRAIRDAGGYLTPLVRFTLDDAS